MIDLNDIGKYKENNRIEAKKAQGGLPSSLWETYSAFANSFGGVILLGVIERNDKTLQTVALPNPGKLVSEFWNIINDPKKVSMNILKDQNVQILESQGNRIVIIEVPRANRREKPVYIGGDPFCGTYRRNGEGDYRCNPDEVRNMMRDQAEISQDQRIMDDMTLNVFDYESIHRYRTQMSRLHPGHVWETLENTAFLQKLGAIATGENGTVHPTAAGLLMFGYENEIIRKFPYYLLDYQEKTGDKTQYIDRIISNSGKWSGNIFDFYFCVYNKIIKDIPSKINETTYMDIDISVQHALQEALANALIHANYYEHCGVIIQKMRDKIVISNPGVLRIGINDAISGGISDPRNMILVKMFNLINVGEHAGRGILDIHLIWKQQEWCLPQIYEQFDPDRTILLLPLTKKHNRKIQISKVHKKLSINNVDKKQLIIEYLTNEVSCKITDICILLDLKERQVRTLMKELVQSDIIVADGRNRNRIYRLKS